MCKHKDAIQAFSLVAISVATQQTISVALPQQVKGCAVTLVRSAVLDQLLLVAVRPLKFAVKQIQRSRVAALVTGFVVLLRVVACLVDQGFFAIVIAACQGKYAAMAFVRSPVIAAPQVNWTAV